MNPLPSPQNVLDFWFKELNAKQWYGGGPEVDSKIRAQFLELHHAAISGQLHHWRADARERLAEVLVLDQFSRNLFRNTPAAFAADPLALERANEAVSMGADLVLEEFERDFLYLPFMHSEQLSVHQQAEPLFQRASANTRTYERLHRDIIERFGRYPHRNQILGRESTPEEIAFLQTPGSSF